MRSFVKVREKGKTPCIATERRHQDRRAISVPLAGVNDVCLGTSTAVGPRGRQPLARTRRRFASRRSDCRAASCPRSLALPAVRVGSHRYHGLPTVWLVTSRPNRQMINLSYRSLIPDVRQVWLQAQPGSDEAAFDKPGLVLDFFRPCRMTWTRWAKLATARLARTPRLSTDQIPSTGLRSGAYEGS